VVYRGTAALVLFYPSAIAARLETADAAEVSTAFSCLSRPAPELRRASIPSRQALTHQVQPALDMSVVNVRDMKMGTRPGPPLRQSRPAVSY